jgi:anti-sigma regulatory factor (Ser/Thr protein kinase)
MAGDSVDDLVSRADTALGATKRATRARAVTRVLAAHPAAAAEARRAALQLRLPQRVRETLELLVSELVTNSVRHAGLPEGAPLNVDITQAAGHVRLAVRDGGPGFDPAQLRDPGPLDPGGRGLAIVAALSAAWGVERDADGCTVWCEVVTEAPAAPSDPYVTC